MSGRKVGKPRKREAKAKSTLKRTKFYAKSNRHRAGDGGAVEAPEGVGERGKHSHGSCAEYEAVVSSI